MSEDPFNLQRFVDAQAPVYEAVTRELEAGRKRTHWMWFVFPQLKGLGRSGTAQAFGLAGLGEAKAYLAHPVLGARLRECVDLVLAVEDTSARALFGTPDDLKFCSSMTLFERADEADARFVEALDKLYGGRRDALTEELLDDAET